MDKMVDDKLNNLKYEQNSELDKLAKSLKNLNLTLKQAKELSYLISSQYHKRLNELNDFCPKCSIKNYGVIQNKKTAKDYKRFLQEHVDALQELNSIFYKYMKYNW